MRFDLATGTEIAAAAVPGDLDRAEVIRGPAGDVFVKTLSGISTALTHYTGPQLTMSWSRDLTAGDHWAGHNAWVEPLKPGMVTLLEGGASWRVLDVATGDDHATFDGTDDLGAKFVVNAQGGRVLSSAWDEPSVTMFAGDGTQQWHTAGVHAIVPVYPGVASLVIGRRDADDRLVALDIATGHERWSVDDPDHVIQVYATTPDLVVLGDNRSQSVIARSADTGARVWAADADDFDAATAYAYTSGRYLYLQSNVTHQFRAYDLATGRVVWTTPEEFTGLKVVGPDLVAIDHDAISLVR